VYSTIKATAIFILLNLDIVFGQRILFDTVKVDASTKIIGRYSRSDKNKIYRKYNFMIEDSAKVAEYLSKFKLGHESFNIIEEPNFKLSVIKNYDELGFWTIFPTYKSATPHDGQSYEFDMNQIADLNKEYPFDYVWKRKVFKAKDAYIEYLEEQKSDPNFLFDYAPQFRYEGSFEIEFERTEKYSSPKAISDFLTPYIEEFVKKGQYQLIYSLNDKNRNNEDQFTMTIKGPKIIFDEMKVDDLINENWKPTVEDAYFFYKK
jgi:hypothetical protein